MEDKLKEEFVEDLIKLSYKYGHRFTWLLIADDKEAKDDNLHIAGNCCMVCMSKTLSELIEERNIRHSAEVHITKH